MPYFFGKFKAARAFLGIKNKLAITLILIFLFLPLVFAEPEISLKAKVDKTKIASNQTFTYTFTITSFERNLPAPQIPKFKNFKILSQSQSSTTSFAKSKVKIVIAYAFVLAPVDIGKFEIEPSTIKIGNKIYAADVFKIEVTPGHSLPKKLLPETEEQPQITL